MRRCTLVLLFLVGMLTFAPRGHAATQEDLSACKLPNGLTLIPQRDSPLAFEKGGFIFKFSSERLAPNLFEAEGKKAASLAELYDRLRREETGDLAYSSLNDGTLGAISGKITDLGEHYLHELDGEAIEPPRPVWGVKERSGKGETTPGTIEGVVEGHCYFLETVNGKFAVVRLVAEQHRAALVQWVYQPDGTTRFAIPKGNISEVLTAPDVAKPPQDKVATAQWREVERQIKEHLDARSGMIEKLMSIVREGAEGMEQVALKAAAIEALGEMRAAEATELLVGQVDFKNPFAGTRASSMEALYPCLAALTKLGKPASRAAVKAIREMHSFDVKGDENRRLERTQLLAKVVHAVEGPEVAKFILERELVKAGPESKKALQEALDYLAPKLKD